MTTTTELRCLECAEPTDNRHRRCSPCHAAMPDAQRATVAPRDVNWPALIAVAERQRIPVLRIDQHGTPHVIRTLEQLRTEWDDT